MRKIIATLLILVSGFANAEITATDVISATNVVSSKMNVAVEIVVLNMETPYAASWKPYKNKCEIYVSRNNAKMLKLLVDDQPIVPMLEGFAAHELAHCVELKTVSQIMGIASLTTYNNNHDVRVQAELMADIVAIMYWKQEYPEKSKHYISTLMDWRRDAGEHDPLHATYDDLAALLPRIPARVDVQYAIKLRDSIR